MVNKLFARLTRGLKNSLWAVALASALQVGVGCCEAAGATPFGSEYQVKAAFLYNFLKFVEWPAEGANSAATICLGVLGQDPFDDGLEAVKGRLAKGRKVVVAHFRSVEEARGCDLLFVSASESRRLPQVLKLAQNYRLLTVGDQKGFCEAGGMINLVFVDNRVGFEVNLGAVSRAKLRISSQLLKMARNLFD